MDEPLELDKVLAVYGLAVIGKEAGHEQLAMNIDVLLQMARVIILDYQDELIRKE